MSDVSPECAPKRTFADHSGFDLWLTPQLSGSQTISQGLLQRLQWAGWAKVSASSHSCDSLLHWAVAWEVTSSDRQLEQTGVERLARRLKILAGSCFGWNGLRSEGCVIRCCARLSLPA
jgi:hypothetical protein